jgi:hypothetical protein
MFKQATLIACLYLSAATSLAAAQAVGSIPPATEVQSITTHHRIAKPQHSGSTPHGGNSTGQNKAANKAKSSGATQKTSNGNPAASGANKPVSSSSVP